MQKVVFYFPHLVTFSPPHYRRFSSGQVKDNCGKLYFQLVKCAILFNIYIYILNKEYIPPEILVSFAHLGFIVYTLRYSKKEKRFSMSFDLKHSWNLALYFVVVVVVQIAG